MHSNALSRTLVLAFLVALAPFTFTLTLRADPGPPIRSAGASADTVIAAWNFNHVTETNSPPPSTGNGTASALGGVVVSLAAGTGSSDPETAADSAWGLATFPAQGRASGTAGAEFRISTAGYRGVRVRFDVRPTATASRLLRLQYSADGSTFTDGPLFTLTAGGAFTNGLTADLAGVSAVADNPRFAVRLVSICDATGRYAAVSGNYSVSGTWRFDEVTVTGEALIGEPGEPSGNGSAEPPVIRSRVRLANLRRPGDAVENTFADQIVSPGERLELQLEFSDPRGRGYRVRPDSTANLPAGSGWVEVPPEGGLTGTNIARFVLSPTTAEEGRLLEPGVAVANDVATNRLAWRIHVPAAAERELVLMEFLANPPTSTTNAAFNPLRRDPPSNRPAQHDEFLELVNFGSVAIDLHGWRLRDATGWRHVFEDSVTIAPSDVLVLQGGLVGTVPPNLDVPWIAAGDGILGLSLNNDGDVIALYNAETNLVFRVVYTADQLAVASSLTRHPDRNGPFVPHATVSSAATSAGRWPDGRRYDEAGNGTSIRLTVAREAASGVAFEWEAEPGAVYTVWRGDSVAGVFVEAATGLRFDGRGRFTETSPPADEARFYRVSRSMP